MVFIHYMIILNYHIILIFKNYNIIDKYIHESINKYNYCIDKLKIIPSNFYDETIIIKNKYSLYLNDIINKYQYIYNWTNKASVKNKQEYLKIINDLLFNENPLNKYNEFLDENIIKKYKLSYYTSIKKQFDINLINLEQSMFINDILKYFDNYNDKILKVKEICNFILLIIVYGNIIDFYKKIYTLLFNNIINKSKTNIQSILNNILKYYNNTIDIFIKNCSFLKEFQTKAEICNFIYFIYFNLKYTQLNKITIDKIFNYIWFKQWKDDEYNIILLRYVNDFFNTYELKKYNKNDKIIKK